MGIVIAVANQKGGVGKSSTAHAIITWLALSGEKVLAIDLDSQRNLTYTMGADEERITALEVLHGTAPAEQAIQHTATGDIIAASRALAGSDKNLTGKGAHLRLKNAITALRGGYDYIILDTPPALGILTINAFCAADYVVIPAQADIYSLQGIGELHDTITEVQRASNPDLKIAGILITRYSGRAILTRDVSDMITEAAEGYQTKVYKAKIREGIAVKEAQACKQDIFSYAPRSNPASDYNDFMKELLADISPRSKKRPARSILGQYQKRK